MSLAKLYNALINAGASPEAATDAMEAIETSLDEPWKRRVEKNFARMEQKIALIQNELTLHRWMIGINLVLTVTAITLIAAILFNMR